MRDLEQQRPQEMGEQRSHHTRGLSLSRPPLPLPRLFIDRSHLGRQQIHRADDDSPKTPHSNATHLPTQPQSSGRNSSRSTLPGPTNLSSGTVSEPSLSQAHDIPVIPEPSPAYPSDGFGNSRAGHSRFRGADPAETELADAVDRRRRRQDRGRVRRHIDRDNPRKFFFCFPWIQSRRLRSQIVRCFVAGILLMLMLAVCKCFKLVSCAPMDTNKCDIDLALSITKNINSNEFTVLLILVILSATIFFCHGLIKICMIIIRPPQDDDVERAPFPRQEPGGYAVPRRPIHVILARDEEVVGNAEPSSKLEPPAYGLWRESVVCSRFKYPPS